MRRGDICNVELPTLELPLEPKAENAPKLGNEQFGRRPGLIVQDNQIGRLPTVVIVPLTKQMTALSYPGAIKIKRSGYNGLDYDSVALVHQVRAIDKRRLRNTIGTIESDLLMQIEEQLSKLLGL